MQTAVNRNVLLHELEESSMYVSIYINVLEVMHVSKADLINLITFFYANDFKEIKRETSIRKFDLMGLNYIKNFCRKPED